MSLGFTTMSKLTVGRVLLLLSTFVITAIDCRKLVWSDEFNGPAGTAPDPKKWHYDIGGAGWGNGELEYYTNSRVNSAMDGKGNLRLTATREGASGHTCWYGPCKFTSARLVTSGLFTTTYGRIEARIMVPHGKGLWPAFWALGNNIAKVSWPACGEIDIMEIRGSDPSKVGGTIHGAGYSGGKAISATYPNPGGTSLANGFHLYAIDWTEKSIAFSLDDHVYVTRNPANIPHGTSWAFNHDFFLVLNLAIGGPFDGSPPANVPFPQSMLVDYVRVYK